MLESFVSSRIRRTLLEYILTHSIDRFYLRGLSKDLGLSLSPLRRELKRLEQSGMITAVPEGNMLFYTVNTHSSAFQQLASFQTTDIRPQASDHRHQTSDMRHKTQVSSPMSQVSSLKSRVSGLKSLLAPLLAVLAVLMLATAVIYMAMTHQKMSVLLSRASGKPTTQLTVVMPSASASGAMHGARWRVVPGGFGGGFSSDGTAEAY